MLDQTNAHAYAHRQRGEPRRRRAGLRDVLVALSSIGVVALLVLYALAGPTAKLSADVGPVVPRPGSTAVVQGRVLEPDGGGLDGAQVVVRRSGRRAGSAVSDDAGAFRVELRGGCASYRIAIRARSAGSTVETVAGRRLCPGDALPVDVRVVTQGHFLWVPGPR
jgi:hypothetical protein